MTHMSYEIKRKQFWFMYKVMSYLSFKLTDIYVSLWDKILKFYHHSLECLLYSNYKEAIRKLWAGLYIDYTWFSQRVHVYWNWNDIESESKEETLHSGLNYLKFSAVILNVCNSYPFKMPAMVNSLYRKLSFAWKRLLPYFSLYIVF